MIHNGVRIQRGLGRVFTCFYLVIARESPLLRQWSASHNRLAKKCIFKIPHEAILKWLSSEVYVSWQSRGYVSGPNFNPKAPKLQKNYRFPEPRFSPELSSRWCHYAFRSTFGGDNLIGRQHDLPIWNQSLGRSWRFYPLSVLDPFYEISPRSLAGWWSSYHSEKYMSE